uniref:Transcriptional regulator CII, putative n=1 Tax=biofilter metagenome TaxID=1070537 RepID=A0A1A7GDV6_9ZZZZ
MSLFDSLRRCVDHYPGARASLAPRIGKTDEVARKELSGAVSHKLGAVDALAMARLCVEAGSPHCYDYPAYVAQECGGEFRPGIAAGASDLSPVHRVTGMVRETSDVTSIVIDAMGDGVISDNELQVIEREVAEAHEALRKLLQAVYAVNRAGKPEIERDIVWLGQKRVEGSGR